MVSKRACFGYRAQTHVLLDNVSKTVSKRTCLDIIKINVSKRTYHSNANKRANSMFIICICNASLKQNYRLFIKTKMPNKIMKLEERYVEFNKKKKRILYKWYILTLSGVFLNRISGSRVSWYLKCPVGMTISKFTNASTQQNYR